MIGEIHFVNIALQSSPIGGMAVANVYTQPPDAVPIRLGSLLMPNILISLPPHAESSFDFGTTLDHLGQPNAVKLAGITGHFHSRGKSFEVRLWDGLNHTPGGNALPGEFDRMGPGATVYRSEAWDEPPFKIFKNDEVEIPAGWGIIYRTVYYNSTDHVITYGPHVATQEHANLFVYFYPGPPNGKGLIAVPIG